MTSIKSLDMRIDQIGDFDTFSEGDCITGKVTLELKKQIKVKSFFVKAKGDASVHWTETKTSSVEDEEDEVETFSAETRFFKLKHLIVEEPSKSLPPGIHVFPFSLSLPVERMPSSFRGPHGKIVYKLEVKLVRSWRMDKNVVKEIKFVSKAGLNRGLLMSPQQGGKDKKMNVFTSGSVSMNIHIERTGYKPGEKVQVTANINNSSSRDLSPKFKLDQIMTFYASGNACNEKKNVCKVVGAAIPSKSQQTVVGILQIPTDLTVSILNFDMIRVEYQVKVSVDVPLGSDPEVTLPLVIIPHGAEGSQPFGRPGHSDFPSPASFGSYHSASGPGGNLNPTNMPAYPPSAATGGNYPSPYPPGPMLQTPPAPMFNQPPPAPMFNQPPTAPMFNQAPAAPMFNQPPNAPMFNQPPTAPTFNLPEFSPMFHPPPASTLMNQDPSSQDPPSYSSFLSSPAPTPNN